MAWTECTSGAAIAMAGKNADASLIAYGSTYKTILDNWSTGAEADIDLETGKSYLSNYSSLPATISGAVANVCASKIAMKIIGYNTTKYLAREADTLLNVNSDIIQKGIKDLSDSSKYKLLSPI